VRAIARSVCAEMHSGFAAVRKELPMNLLGRRAGVTPSDTARSEIDRIFEIWSDCRRQFGAGGEFLFGRFGIADAMYAPVVTRFATYGVALSGSVRDYAEAIQALPSLKEWTQAAREEDRVITAPQPRTPVA
jgi:glutathione S-transferase